MAVQVFLSWSGVRSRRLAAALRDWLPSVLQVVEPWFSAADVPAGSRWSDELRSALLQAHVGIVCVTPECLQSQWLSFEAGVLFRLQAGERFQPPVYVFPVDVLSHEIRGPLSQFQWTQPDKEGTYRLVAALNTIGANERLISEEVLRRAFDANWPALELALSDIRASAADVSGAGSDELREIPPPPALFVGRGPELDQFATLTVGERPATAICIYGDAGTGKTALACELAQRYSNRYTTQLYVAAGLDTRELKPVEILRYIVHKFGLPSGSTLQRSDSVSALGLTEELPDAEHELLVRYLAEMRRRPVFLLLDNVREPNAVKNLIPPRGSVLVVTSRTPVAPGDFRLVRMGDLRPGDARELITITAPGAELTEDEVRGLSPLGINIAATIHLRHPDLDIKLCLDKVRRKSDDEGHPAAGYIAEAMYEYLDISVARRWCSLVVFPGSFTSDAAAAVWSVSNAEAETVLQVLVESHLLTLAAHRYSLPDAFREFATAKLTNSQLESARLRHSRHYAAFAENEAPDLVVGQPARSRCMEKLQAEHSNLQAVISRSGTSREQSVIALRTAGALFWYWNFRGALEEGRLTLTLTLGNAGKHAPPEVEALARYGLGGLCFLQSDYSVARKELTKALQLATETQQEVLQGFVGIVLGMVLLEQSEYERDTARRRKQLENSEALQRASLDIFERNQHAWGRALANNDLGRVLLASGSYEEAEHCFRTAFDLWSVELNDDWGCALTLGAWGFAALSTKRYKEAERYLSEAVSRQRKLRDRWGTAGSLLDLGSICLDLGRHDEAVSCLYESLELNRQLGRHRLVADCIIRVAILAERLGEPEFARRFREHASTLREKANLLTDRTPVIRSTYQELAIAVDEVVEPTREWLVRKGREAGLELRPQFGVDM